MINQYTFQDMEFKCSEDNIALFKEIHNNITSLHNVVFRITKAYICYDVIGGNRFCTLNPYKSKIELYMDMGDSALIDPKRIVEFFTQSERNKNAKGRSSYRIIIQKADNLDYLMELVKQAYHVNGGVKE